MSFFEALRSFQDHAGVNYPQTQRQATRAWRVLKEHLAHPELSELSVAWSHATTPSNASRQELDDVCAKIREMRR